MIWLFAAGVVSIWLIVDSVNQVKAKQESAGETVGATVLGILFLHVVAFIIATALALPFENTAYEITVEDDAPLAQQDGFYVELTETTARYATTGDTFNTVEVPLADVNLVEEDRQDAFVRVHRVNRNMDVEWFMIHDTKEKKLYEIHVPHGNVKHNITAEL